MKSFYAKKKKNHETGKNFRTALYSSAAEWVFVEKSFAVSAATHGPYEKKRPRQEIKVLV